MLRTILNRPIAVLTVFIVTVVISGLLVLDIPLGMYPEVDIPILFINVPYFGAGPEEVEEEITRRIESELSGLDGMDSMTSTSSEGMAQIIMEFQLGTDIIATEAEVRSRLGRIVPFLPKDSLDPILNKFDPSALPVIALTISGDRNERELVRIADDNIVPLLEGLKGVASVELSGGRDTIIQVNLDQNSLEAYNLSVSRISALLAMQNFQLGSGSFTEAQTDILIRTNAKFKSLQDIEQTVILMIPDIQGGIGTPIKLGDIASVKWGYSDSDNTVLIDNSPGIILTIRKSSGANSVDVAEMVENELSLINKVLPPGVELTVLSNPMEVVISNLASVASAVTYGIFFAVIVLFVFLRQIRSTFIVGISIPISLVVTVAILAVTGRSINIVTIIGLAMGVGLIVDSSIVIIENIYRYRMKGSPLDVSARRGAGEMMNPILASSLTTIAVFFPIIIYKNELGFLGVFFGELALTIIIAILSSLVVAAILVPVLSAHFLTIHTREERPVKSKFIRFIDNGFERFFIAMENQFGNFLVHCMKNKILVIFTTILIMGGSFLLASILDIKMMPDMPETSIRFLADFPAGTSQKETQKVMEELNSRINREIEDTDRIIMIAGKSEGSLEITLNDNVNKYVEIPQIKKRLRKYFSDYPDVDFEFDITLQGSELLSSSGVDVAITGTNWNAVIEIAEEIEMLMENVDEFEEITNESAQGLPQAEIIIDRRALYEQNLSAQMVAIETRALAAGFTATEFSRNGNSFDVVVRLNKRDRSTIEDLERMFLVNASGERVSLSQIAEIRRTSGPVDITRENQVKTIHVVGTLSKGAKMDDVTKSVAILLDEKISPATGVKWAVGGELDDFQETGATMLIVMGIAALLVIAVMVAQFESFKDPLVIALALPMMFVGVIGIFAITDTTISMISMMGIIMLLGIVVNNGIVLVDHTRLMRRRGMGLEEACVESGRTRLRPVLMTTLTTVLAMTPLAFFPGEGGEVMQPMGVAVFGGLLSSTIGTLILVPTLYSIFHRKENDNNKLRKRNK